MKAYLVTTGSILAGSSWRRSCASSRKGRIWRETRWYILLTAAAGAMSAWACEPVPQAVETVKQLPGCRRNSSTGKKYSPSGVYYQPTPGRRPSNRATMKRSTARSDSALSSLSLAGLVGAATTVRLDARQGRPPPPARETARSRACRLAIRTRLGAGRRGQGQYLRHVVVAGSGQPARRARVSLSGGGEAGGSRSTTSDDQGRFAFSRAARRAIQPVGLEGRPLRRHLRTAAAGPTGHADPARRRSEPAGAAADTRGSVITGTVLDEHGEAVPGTPVRALRYVMQSGQRTLQSAGSGQTDDRGVYRIYGLQPGDYLVFATPRNSNQRPRRPSGGDAQLVQQSAAMARLEAVAGAGR